MSSGRHTHANSFQPNCAAEMSDSLSVEVQECERRFREDLIALFKYYEFKDIHALLRAQRLPAPSPKRDKRTVADIVDFSMKRDGASKIKNPKKRQRLKNEILQGAKEIVAESAVRHLEANCMPDKPLGEEIANEISWPDCIPEEVRKAEEAFATALSKADGSPNSANAVELAAKEAETKVQQWTKNTVGKTREKYKKALINVLKY